MPTVKPPSTLDAAGKVVWKAITSKFELRPDELVTLEDVCVTTDMITALERAWSEDGRPMTAKGSMGQLIIHPIIGELRTQRMARNRLWAQLKLPDDVSSGERVNQHRDAANTRWSQGRGA